MSERYYVNCPLKPGRLVLQGAEARHLAVVCRLRPGESVYLFNGDGREYRTEITSSTKNRVELNVLDSSAIDRELSARLTLACPLPKGDRGRFLIEKLTELGVAAYIPLQTQRSVVHPSESRVEKLQRYVIEASKQCGRNVLMRIELLSAWDEFVQRSDLPACKLVADPTGELLTRSMPIADAVAAVGPEGGFSPEELAMARSTGWNLINLGPRVLRVETAAIALAGMLSLNQPTGTLPG